MTSHPPNVTQPAPPQHGKAGAIRTRRRLKLFCLVLVALVAALALLELLQWTLLPAPHPLRRRPGPAVFTFHTDGRLLPGISGETTFTTESHGLRYPREFAVPKPAGVYRIFCVGGSTTECTYLDDADAWPARIESILLSRRSGSTIEVINAGFSGLTTADHVEQIEAQLIPMQPDCIILMAGMNDHIRRNSLGQATGGSWSRMVMDYSMTARRLIVLWRAIGSSKTEGTYEMDPSGEIYRRLRAESAAIPIASETAAFDALPDPLPSFSANITRIADTCRERQITLVLATHPSIYADALPEEGESLLWMRALVAVNGLQPSLAWHVNQLKRLNDWTRQFARSRGLILIDADSALSKSIESFYDDCHLTVEG